MNTKVFVFISFLIVMSLGLYAQKSRITGKVINSKTGEPLIGATVSIVGTNKNTQTDQNGYFSIGGLEASTYSITCTYVSFSKKTLPGIRLKDDDVLSQDILMDRASDMSSVVVKSSSSGNKPKETVNSLLIAQKNSANVSDGISAETIKKTPDKNTSDIIKRVSGASIQEDKFVIVRGLNERYNAAFINGSPLPSTEADRKAFSFDIFPANMLDNVIIVKTATPDMNAEFAGGTIFINTKDIVSKNYQIVSVGSGYNTLSSFKNFRTYKGGKLDYLGLDDGTRALPSYIPSTDDFPQPAAMNPDLAKNWKNEWATNLKKSFLNGSFQYVNGASFQRKDKDFISTLFALTYSRNTNIINGINKEHAQSDTRDTSVPNCFFNQTTYSINTMIGAIANISLRINSKNSVSFKNLYSINSEDKVIERVGSTGLFESDPLFSIARTLWFTCNRFYINQLLGEHYFPHSKIKLNWIAANSEASRTIPDLRTTIYTRYHSEPDTILHAAISDNATTNGNGGGIYYSNLNEVSKNIKFDIQRTFKFSNSISSNFKVGAYIQDRNRIYNQRNFGMVKGNVGSTNFNYQLLNLPENQIFSTQNIGAGGFILAEDKNYTNNYNAITKLNAGYIMQDARIGNWLRLIYGVRAEQYHLNLVLPQNILEKDTVKSTVNDLLPSLNLIFSLSKSQNLRLSYSNTINRPEFRELAPAKFFDFATRYVTNGDTSLKRALIHNYDLRYEIYPGSGQVISASIFYKEFKDPIEQATAPDKDHEAAYFNVLGAVNKGFEIDARINIGSILKSKIQLFNHFTVFSNASFINSVVNAKKSTDNTVINLKRPLQGQSPYCFNAGLTYQNDEKGWSSTIVSNKIGQRIFIVGNVTEPNIWENGRTLLDFQISKKIKNKNFEIKLNVKDILAQKSIFFEDTNNDNKYKNNEDYIRWYRSFGTTYSLLLSYKF